MNNMYGFIVYEQPVEGCFPYAQEHGIGHLEIDLMKKHSMLSTFTPTRIDGILELCEAYGIQVSLHPPYNLNLCAGFLVMRRMMVSYLKKYIRLAHRLKATHVTLHIGYYNRTAMWQDPRHHALDRLLKSLRHVLPLCETYGVSLALENVIPIPMEAGFSFLGDNLEDFEYIFSRFDSPYVKFCLDVGHANTTEGPLEYLDHFGDRLVNVHYHDNLGKRDEHLDVGHGNVPWEALGKRFRQMEFTGPFVSECFKSQPHEAKEKLEKYL